ncbi:MAG: hypothetical protein QOJ20_734, partial [Mycobacterium sp.]|nr:hypothetical protein [Mycobacterium sp.]
MNTIPDEAGLQGADFGEGARFIQPKQAGVMRTKALGTLGTTSAIGLGLMGMSDLYGPSDRAESIATIGAALDAGITLL